MTNLDNYLGALGHVVVISEDTEQYLHVHPNDQADKGPNIGFNTNFEKPGLYRVFLQFNHGGQDSHRRLHHQRRRPRCQLSPCSSFLDPFFNPQPLQPT